MRQPAGGPVLALDTSGDPASACLLLRSGALELRVAPEARRAGEVLHEMLRALFEAREVEAADLSCVAAVVGPGSFTGLRVGLAAVAGLGLAVGVPVAGFETTRVVAQASRRLGDVLVVLDGGQGRHFVGRHRVEAGAVARALEGPLDLSPAETLSRVAGHRGPALWRGPRSPDADAFLAAGCVPCGAVLAPAVAELAQAEGPAAPGTILDALYARAPAIRPPSGAGAP